MKAIMTFEYNPAELDDLKHMMDMQRVDNYKMVLWDFSQYLRSKLKHEKLSEAQNDVYEEVRIKFLDIIADHEVNID